MSEADNKILEEATGFVNLVLAIRAAVEARTTAALRQHGLTFPQYEILCTADDVGQDSIGSIAEVLHCSRGNLTGVLDRLERDGWLVRERPKKDRRVVRPRFTPKGATIRSIRRRIAGEMSSWVAGMSAANLEALSILLKKALQVKPRSAGA